MMPSGVDVVSAANRLVGLALAEIVLSSVIALVVLVVSRILGRRWPALQHALWALVLLRLLLPPGLAHPLGAGTLLARSGLGSPWGERTEQGAPSDATAGVPDAGTGPSSTDVDFGRTVLVGGWALAVGLLCLRDWSRARTYRRIIATAEPVTAGLAVRLAERWRRRLGIKRSVRLIASDAPISPFTDGVLRPVVFLPSSLLLGAHRHALAAAVAHELGHVARFDVLGLRLERWVTRLYFFHPAVWLASRRLHTLREGLCDALATSNGLVTPRLYVRGLLDLLQLDLQGVEAPSLTLSQRRILMRLETVLANRTRRPHRSLPALLAAAAVGFFLLPLANASAPVGGTVVPPSGASAAGGTDALSSPPLTAMSGPVSAEPLPSGKVTDGARPSLADPLPSGKVTRRFGKSLSPVGKGEESHKGIDLAARNATPVLAADAGTVELAVEKYAKMPTAGTVIVLDHGNGRKTFYSHLSTLAVEAGQRVTRGQAIGGVGNTGVSTGPHLHFEVWEDGKHVDPAAVVPALQNR